VAPVQIAMMGGLRYTALRDAILTHPTLVEGLIPLLLSPPSLSRVGKAPAERLVVLCPAHCDD
jgi:hypothetical protein